METFGNENQMLLLKKQMETETTYQVLWKRKERKPMIKSWKRKQTETK